MLCSPNIRQPVLCVRCPALHHPTPKAFGCCPPAASPAAPLPGRAAPLWPEDDETGAEGGRDEAGCTGVNGSARWGKLPADAAPPPRECMRPGAGGNSKVAGLSVSESVLTASSVKMFPQGKTQYKTTPPKMSSPKRMLQKAKQPKTSQKTPEKFKKKSAKDCLLVREIGKNI